MSVIVVGIGCLECQNETDILGVYPTADAARAAFPEATLRTDMTNGYDWHGSYVEVIFDLPEETR